LDFDNFGLVLILWLYWLWVQGVWSSRMCIFVRDLEMYCWRCYL